MQKEFRAVLFTVVCSAGLSSPIAYAADGTITFTGKVLQQTCTIDTNNQNKTVTLPSVSAAAFAAPGGSAARTPLELSFTNCPAGQQVSAYFEPGITVDSTSGHLNNTAKGNDVADNVQIRLLDDNLTKIKIDGTANPTQWITTSADQQSVTLNYFAEYVASGVVTPGNVTSNVSYVIIYK